jgi:heme-degrading monooxygenase HmoA
MYISITGLTLIDGLKSKILFFWYSYHSYKQAQKASGNVSISINKINNVYHTLSVWQKEADMRDFLYSGHHKKAIMAFRTIANGKTFGFESNEIPSWKKVQQLWEEKGKTY